MSFLSIAKSYLYGLQELYNAGVRTRQATPELSYRPLLNSFFSSLIQEYTDQEIRIIFEPVNQYRRGRPDWRFYNNVDFGLYGFAESKGLDPENSISLGNHESQIRRYLELQTKVILTDGIEFLFFDRSFEDLERFSLISKPVSLNDNWSSQNIDVRLEIKFRQFFSESGFRISSDEDLIKEIALRARNISSIILDLTEAPLNSGLNEDENNIISYLHDLRHLLVYDHDTVLNDPKYFSDFVAQVLVFGLLYAHRSIIAPADTTVQRYDKIKAFWHDVIFEEYSCKLMPFKGLVNSLYNEFGYNTEFTNTLISWYDDTIKLLAHLNLEDGRLENPDYHTLYEKFLSYFDPKTRYDYGAFYTPQSLVSFSIKVVKHVFILDFNITDLYNPNNLIIEPCCGTGTFIEQMIINCPPEGHLKMIGIEILPAPYALANYRLKMIEGFDRERHNISLFLTNTLSDRLVETVDYEDPNYLQQELINVTNKLQDPLILVIGNPPSSDSFSLHNTGPTFQHISNLLDDFRPPVEERTSRQNVQKQINNDFMKFLRWSVDKVLTVQNGGICLILPSAFCTHQSYAYARRYLQSIFNKFFILEIDNDIRTGIKSSNLFNTLQGRILLIAIRKQNSEESNSYFHHSITNFTKNQKIDYLNSDQADYLSNFTAFSPSELNIFKPVSTNYDLELYSRFWNVYKSSTNDDHYVFSRQCSGIKLAPSSLFTHSDENILIRKAQDISRLTMTYEQLCERWFSGQTRVPPESKLSLSVRSGFQNLANTASIKKYNYRPFIELFAILDSELLRLVGAEGGGGTRFRPELLSAFATPNVFGLAISPSRVDIGDDLHRFSSFCWYYPDNDLGSRGNAHIVTNFFPEYKQRAEWNPLPVNNCNNFLLTYYRDLGINVTNSDFIFYCYAILCSDNYLNAFKDALYVVSSENSVPKIPIVADTNVFNRLVNLGKEIALLEKRDDNYIMNDYHNSLLEEFNISFQFKKAVINEEEETISLVDVDNMTRYKLANVSSDVLSLKIGGYVVISKTLEYLSFKFTRCEFSKPHFSLLLETIDRIENQLLLIQAVDGIMEQILRYEIELY